MHFACNNGIRSDWLPNVAVSSVALTKQTPHHQYNQPVVEIYDLKPEGFKIIRAE